ncbi:MAG: hypothetical protein IPO32_08810 [Crocinitomicaceae bacterium]|nr:hypothetical protein [Crocinitomicaceae bacterium]
MKTSAPFQFKQFAIHQNLNPQKVGTDSMLLGAWSTTKHKNILDIGTGTGILAYQKKKTVNSNAHLFHILSKIKWLKNLR